MHSPRSRSGAASVIDLAMWRERDGGAGNKVLCHLQTGDNLMLDVRFPGRPLAEYRVGGWGGGGGGGGGGQRQLSQNKLHRGIGALEGSVVAGATVGDGRAGVGVWSERGEWLGLAETGAGGEGVSVAVGGDGEGGRGGEVCVVGMRGKQKVVGEFSGGG